MTITLAPEAETALRKTAQRTGQEPDTIVSRLVLERLTQIEQDYAADIAAIHEAMEDVKAGRERPYEQYMAERRVSFSDASSA
jgi:predicted transcriptional regulator